MKKYRKKPVVIEATEYKRDENISSCIDFCPNMIYNPKDNEYDIVTAGNNIFCLKKKNK